MAHLCGDVMDISSAFEGPPFFLLSAAYEPSERTKIYLGKLMGKRIPWIRVYIEMIGMD